MAKIEYNLARIQYTAAMIFHYIKIGQGLDDMIQSTNITEYEALDVLRKIEELWNLAQIEETEKGGI